MRALEFLAVLCRLGRLPLRGWHGGRPQGVCYQSTALYFYPSED